jgi:hypothetical protein
MFLNPSLPAESCQYPRVAIELYYRQMILIVSGSKPLAPRPGASMYTTARARMISRPYGPVRFRGMIIGRSAPSPRESAETG